MNDNPLPDDALASREYQVRLGSGATATIVFTLGDMAHASAASAFARSVGARAFGLISFAASPCRPVQLFVWTHDEHELRVTVAKASGDLGAELPDIIGHYICRFLAEVAPQIARLDVADPARPTNDNAAD